MRKQNKQRQLLIEIVIKGLSGAALLIGTMYLTIFLSYYIGGGYNV